MNPALLAVTAPLAVAAPRVVDLLAFLGMGLVWLIIGAIAAAIAFVLRARQRDPESWGGPGL